MLVVSEVQTTSAPSGDTAMPSGSMPTWISSTIFLAAMSMTLTTLSFSLAM